MALDGTLTGLQASLRSFFFNRTDLPETDLIALAEARMSRDLRMAFVEAEAPVTGVVDSRYASAPSGMLTPIALFREDSTGRVALDQVLPEMDTSADAGQPFYWAIDGAQIAFERPCDTAYEFTLRYIGKLGLTEAAPTNALLTNHPDCYLYATLLEAAIWNKDAEAASTYNQRYEAARDEVNSLESMKRRQKLRTEFPLTGWFDIRLGDGLGSGGTVLGF